VHIRNFRHAGVRNVMLENGHALEAYRKYTAVYAFTLHLKAVLGNAVVVLKTLIERPTNCSRKLMTGLRVGD
jgi:hypothetical protein